MKEYTYLIVGGGVAGTTAAETIRKNDGDGSIGIISDEPYRFYSRIMLSKPGFFLGKVPFEQIWLKQEEWYTENRIDFLGGKKAVALDPTQKTLQLENGEEYKYTKLLLATGAHARQWNIKGADKKGLYCLRTLDDAQHIIEAIKTAKRAVTIGGGFISFEMADLLKLAGIDVTMLIRESYFWEPILDAPSGHMIEKALEKGGVKIKLNTEVQEISGNATIEGVVLKDRTNLPCNMIVAGVGVVCEHAWLETSGLKTNRGILANEYLEANLPDVWAAGDVAEFNDLILGETVQLGNWVNAQEQGKIAAMNMTGSKKPFKFVSFYTTQGFGITIAFAGDVRPGKDSVIITRGSSDINSYARLIVMNKELIGATMINRTQELRPIMKLIESNMDVSMYQKELSDTNYDLKNLINEH